MAGCGRAQRWGGPIEEIHPGDVVWFPPGEKHWHGAAPTTALTHIAVQENLNGKAVDWTEKVSDEQYSISLQRSKEPIAKRVRKRTASKSTAHFTSSAMLSEWLLNSGAYMHWISAMPVW